MASECDARRVRVGHCDVTPAGHAPMGQTPDRAPLRHAEENCL